MPPTPGWLERIVHYATKTFGLRQALSRLSDGRRKPVTATSVVATVLFYTGLLRIRSFNALEPKLRERPFLYLVGAVAGRAPLCSVDTLGRALRVMDLEALRQVLVGIVQRAERNKVFRAGWHGGLRLVAIDGWESICSRDRHCPDCLTRQVRMKNSAGEIVEITEYYHRYAVAMLIDPLFDLCLDIEPLRPKDMRPPRVPKAGKFRGQSLKREEDEGELTAATRLVARVKETYGWVDVVVADALYANGPFLTELARLGLGAVIVARKEGDEPLRAALRVWGNQPAEQCFHDERKHEDVELWDLRDLQTLSTYAGPIRVVRGRVSKSGDPPTTWCMLVTGVATRLTARSVLATARGRWHIENTGFHQWTTRWEFDHVFVHHGDGILALYWLFFAAYNVLTLYLYRQVRSYGRLRGKDVTRTISRFVDELLDDLARLTGPILDTS
jgi:hypothetical protein